MSKHLSNQSALIKRAQSRFISIDEFCIDNLSMYAMAVYMQLRLLSDFSKAYDEIKVTIGCLAKRAKMSTRKVYDALNELENVHHVIQRLNYHHFRYGQVNSFNVARDFGYFKPKINIDQNVQECSTPAQNDMGVQNFTTPAPYAVATAPNAGGTAQNDIPNKTRSSAKVLPKKQNKEPINPSVFVFSDKEIIKTHVEDTLDTKGDEAPDDIINQVVFYAAKYIGCDKEVKKKINVALKLIREGKWLIPQGYEGTTSQSIREKEEQHQREKQALHQQEAQAFRALTQAVHQGPGMRSMKDVLNHLKGITNDTQADTRSMQKKAV